MITENRIILKDRVTSKMTDEEFLWFCLENKDLRIERNSNREIIFMSPVSTLSAYSSGAAFNQLSNWALNDGRGIAFDSSAGFTLPDQSVLSPDASWVSKQQWGKLSEDEKNKFAPVCPEFIIEVKSKSDRMDDLKDKMQNWIKNGAKLGWLIDIRTKSVFVYKPDKPVKDISGQIKIIGEDPVKGFVLELSILLI
jgi:Uma2 family endonuclease